MVRKTPERRRYGKGIAKRKLSHSPPHEINMKKGLEEYGIKRIIGEILDHFRSMVLDILPRKVMGKEIGR
jgi:hypothetical protein